MQLITLLLVMVLCIMINTKGQQNQQDDESEIPCFPNGCYYDLEEHLTKKKDCKPDGSLEVLYFDGNNGCDKHEYLLYKESYKSHRCCISDSSMVKRMRVMKGTEYSITIHNSFGEAVEFGVFQVQPLDASEGDGNYSIIFTQFSVPNNAKNTIRWSIDWGLSYSSGGIGCEPLEPGVTYDISGDPIFVEPGKSNNAAIIKYDTTVHPVVWDMDDYSLNNLDDNQIGIQTGSQFSEEDAKSHCLTVSVTIGQTPVFVMNGEPSKEYHFTLKPQYYITSQETSIGTTVSAEVTGMAQTIDFVNGNNIKCEYNNHGQFEKCEYN